MLVTLFLTFCKVMYFIYRQRGVRKAQQQGIFPSLGPSLRQPNATLLPLQPVGLRCSAPGRWEGQELPLPTEGTPMPQAPCPGAGAQLSLEKDTFSAQPDQNQNQGCQDSW